MAKRQRSLKTARKKQGVNYRETPRDTAGQKRVAKYTQSLESKKSAT